MKKQNKQQKLDYARKQLKKDFIGIDSQIDSIIDSIAAWYLHPELCTKPTVVCLWSITGLGKTTLVKNLVGYLGLGDRFASITFSAKSDKSMTINQVLTPKFAPVEQGILFLDEFQRYKSIDRKENDIRNNGYDDLWNLLSDGQILKPETVIYIINHINDTILEYKSGLIEELLNAIADTTAKDKDCVYRSSGDPLLKHPYSGKYDSSVSAYEYDSGASTKIVPTHKFMNLATRLGKKSFKELYELRKKYKAHLYEEDLHNDREKAICIFESLNYVLVNPVPEDKWETTSLDEAVDLLKETLAKYSDGLPYDRMAYKKLLVIIAGNQDELFGGRTEFTSSYKDVELLYDQTSRLKWYQLKSLLLNNLYPEQISRLGTNHILYPSLNEDSYRKILSRYVNKIVKEFAAKGITLNITKNAMEALYRNSVFPAQGVRPIQSRVQEILASPISLYTTVFTKDKKIEFDIDMESGNVIINKKKHKCKVNLEITDKESEVIARKDTSTIVHEVGHAITSMWLYNLPCLIDMAPINESEAYTQFIFSQIPNYKNIEGLNKTALASICIYLAGRAAEEFVFGTENTSNGNYSDYKYATLMATNLLRNVGNGSGIAAVSPQLTSPFDIDSDLTHAACDTRDAEVEALLKKEYNRAKEILLASKPVLIAMVEFLQKKAYMSREDCKPFLKRIQALKKGTVARVLSATDMNDIWSSFKTNGVKHLNKGNL